ncbi:MAG TPA: nitroreductase [Nitrospiraceae bacterium]|nr:nitroreductase [Nitrospiraceae bacterium]
MEVMEAIYHRRSVRAYTDQKVDRATIETLIKAAVQAPSSMNEQPWAFGVIQNTKLLTQYSERIKAYVLRRLKPGSPLEKYRELLSDTNYHVFHQAGTLVIICARADAHNGAEDCCLAAQNLMLAAHAMGLGTCPIGLARPRLNQARVKRDMGIADQYAPVFPLVVGYPKGETAPVERKAPEILFWRESL